MADILHKGTIKKAGDGKVTLVLDTDENDCSGCAIAAVCTKGTEVTLDYPGADPSMRGRKVDVVVASGMRTRATVCYLLIPVLLLIASIAVVIWLGGGDLAACCASVGVMALWYGIVYLMRRQIAGSARIKIV